MVRMSCSLPREPPAWLADRRGQTEPIAALVAVLAIAIGLGLYAGVAANHSPSGDRTDADATLQRIEAATLEDGVWSRPTGDRRISTGRFERPGEAVRIEIGNGTGVLVAAGSRAPDSADRASRPVTLDRGHDRIPARLTVWVWER